MKTLKVYRNGSTTLAERIGHAIEHYAIHNGRLPAAIVVNPRDVAETTQVVKALDLDLPVMENGGALLGEVWLVVPRELLP
jgi:hypothetical protein